MSKAIQIEQGTDLWKAWRRGGIGGSDAPVVEGLSPYKTIRQLYFDKKGKEVASDGDSSEFIFQRGHQVEGLIRKQFQELMRVEMAPICFEHDKYEYIRASLDGFDSKLGVLEAKLVGQAVLKKALEGEIPDHHMSQMQHQLFVSGADVGQYFCHDGKKNGALVVVRSNKAYIEKLVEKEHAFWEVVKLGEPPALSDRDYLEPEDQTLLRKLRDAKELAENAAAEYESLKELCVNTFGGHPKIAGAGVKLIRASREGSVSWMKIPEILKVKESLQEDYVDKFRGKASEYWTIRIDGK